MIAALLDHLWQSTLFAAVICLIVPLFRSNSAAVRFWLWFAASVKFLVSLSIFTFAGHQLLASFTPAMPARLVTALQPVAIPFSAGKPVLALSVAPHLMLTELAVAAWALGAALVLVVWLLHWARLRAVLRNAADLPFATAVPVKAARSCLEPGLVGIWRPVILLPEGISEKLSPMEMEAVMTHELCHLRRRDNLLAAVHMLVEALFWFHPLVWWLGGRLADEREHACDEKVLAAGNPPLVYAEGILKVCRFYVQSPLPCASGVSGATLETRVGAILRNHPVQEVEDSKRALLVFLAAASVMVPLLAGSPPVSSLARRVATEIAAQADLVRLPITAMAPDPQPVPKKSTVFRPRRHVLSAPALRPDLDAGQIETALPVILAPAPATASAALPQNADAKAGVDEADAIVCRPSQSLPGSRFSGPVVCLSKGEWAQLRTQGKDVSADGRAIVDADGEKYRSLHPRYCAPAVATAATAGNVMGVRSICF